MYIRASQNGSNDSVNFQFVDSNSQLIFNKSSLSLFRTGFSHEIMYYIAMKQHDSYHLDKVAKYNIGMTVYITRNRLILWANGAPLEARLEKKEVRLIIPYILFRDIGGDVSTTIQTIHDVGLFD